MPLAYVMMNVELGSEEAVLNGVRKISSVKECYRIYGVYDMIAKVEGDSLDAIKQVVTWKIRKLSGVRSTLTTIVIE